MTTENNGAFVFIDARTLDIQTLIDGVQPGEQVFVIDGGSDGLSQIASILAANHATNLSSISIVGHGAAGEIEIGATVLDDADLAQHADALAAIGSALTPGGDLNLFACNTAQGAAGAQFITDLSLYAGGADVQAATHVVGSANFGGSFVLDAATGAHDVATPFTQAAQDQFDGVLAGSVTGQLWFGIDASPPFVGHVNSDGTGAAHSGDETDSTNHEIESDTIGLDLPAGFFFQTNTTDYIRTGVPLSISSYRTSDQSIIGSVEIGDPTDPDQVNALAVDPINHFVYVARWGVDAAHSGIVKVSYNPATGVLDPTAAYNSTPTFVFSGANGGLTAGNDIRAISLDVANQVLYFSVNNNDYSTTPYSPSNAIFRVNTNGTGLTQITTAAQFPAALAFANQHTAIGPMVVDVAKGLVYFETNDQSNTSGIAKLWYISSSASGGTAVAVTGVPTIAYGDATQGGLSLDAQTQQLYIATQSNSGNGVADQVLQLQLSADGHSITSTVNTDLFAALYGSGHVIGQNITGTAFDQLPTLTATGTSTHAAEQSTSVTTLTAQSSSDTDGDHYAGATVQITGGTFSSNENSTADDHLTINSANSGTVSGTSIALSYNSATETLTLSGYDTIAHYNAALALVKYNTTGDNPTNYGGNTTRTITYAVSDGAVGIAAGSAQNSTISVITIDAVNDVAVLATGSTISYTEQAAAATIDTGITVSDPDNLNEASATVVISAGFQTGDTLAATVTGTSITASYASGTLTLSGSDTLAHYQQVLRTVSFANTANNDPTAGGTATSRTIQFTTDDGTVDPLHLSNTLNATVNITAVNDAPTAAAPGTHYAATEQVTLTLKNTGLSVADVDGASGSETLTLSVGEGTLTATAGNSGATIGGTGTSSITVAGTVAQINAFLNTATSTLSYIDNTDTPSASTTVSLSINDNGNTGGGSLTGTASSTIDITAVNDAPTAAVPVAAYAATEQVTLTLKNTGLSVADVDGASGSETLTLSVGEGTLTAAAGNSGATIGGTGTSSITVAGTVAQINAFLNTATSTLSYIDNTDTPSASTTLSLSISDNGHTGTGGTLIGMASQTVNVTAVDDPAVAVADTYAVNSNTTLNKTAGAAGNGVLHNDTDPDGPTVTVTGVTGGTLGTRFTLPSGALLTVNVDGSFVYDTNHVFDTLADPSTGASNSTATDTFTYTVDGGSTATATITITGVADSADVYHGTSGNDTIVGDNNGHVFDLSGGGNDTVTGGTANDGFSFGAAYTTADHVDGGGGTQNQLGLTGDYSAGVNLGGTSIQNIQTLVSGPSFNYSYTTSDDLVASGKTFTFWSVSMTSANHITINGAAETNGSFNFFMGQGNDVVTGGAGNDLFYGEGGADTLKGNGGADIFSYLAVSDSTGNSTGTAYDSILDFTAGTDKIHVPVSVMAIDTTVATGTLNNAGFDTNLAAAIGASQLAAHHAVLFTPSAGLTGHTFLIVDANGTAGYQAGADFVIDVTGMTGTLTTADFA